MSLLSDVKKVRDERKQVKRNHLLEATVHAIKKGTYKFNYGFNSDEDYQELIEVVDELNKELKDDKFVLIVSQQPSTRNFAGYEITIADKSIGKFYFFVQISVDAL